MAIYRYPVTKLDKSEDYLLLQCMEYEPPGVNLDLTTFSQRSSDELYNSLGSQTILGTVILPIPDNIPQSSNSVRWDDSSMGPLQSIGMGVAMNTIKGGYAEGYKALATATQTGIDALSKTGRGQKLAQSFFASKAVEQLFGQGQNDLFGTVLGRETGAVFNENVELLFRGINLREGFNFSFDISPRDATESQKFRELVLFLKRQMSAKKGLRSGAAAGLFLTAPSVFKVQYMSGTQPHPYLNRFKICALQALSLNYVGSGSYATYSDGTPVHMQLTLGFRELTPIYSDDYPQDDKSTPGTGY